ncbi:MAG: GntG family PLP-dependent aldolase [Acidimicrobiia bacterium]|nr:GntG family PLP-dependent aldolase [Acidimicrobiia bacterium]
MRRAMADAEVGDDMYREDPTVRRLEERFAARLDKPAALYVPSGTMANQVALRVLGEPGTTVVVGRRQHVVVYENGAAGINAQVQFETLDDSDGTLDPDTVRRVTSAAAGFGVRPSAVFVENTHMPAGGVPWSIEQLRDLASIDLPVHIDGARLFNAAVATGVEAAAYAATATTVMCCLSKGLGAPVGSLLAADEDRISEAREHRQRLGGAMRQAGVIAATGLVALDHHVERLADDHRRARSLAEAVADRWPGALDPATVRTNMVVFEHPDADGLLAHLRSHDVLAATIAPDTVRFVTHLDVDDDGLDRACKALADAPR